MEKVSTNKETLNWQKNNRREHYIKKRLGVMTLMLILMAVLDLHWAGLLGLKAIPLILLTFAIVAGVYLSTTYLNVKNSPKMVAVSDLGIHLKYSRKDEYTSWEDIKSISPSSPLIILYQDGRRKTLDFLDNDIKNKIYSTHKSH